MSPGLFLEPRISKGSSSDNAVRKGSASIVPPPEIFLLALRQPLRRYTEVDGERDLGELYNRLLTRVWS
jgi:hypothetical protein